MLKWLSVSALKFNLVYELVSELCTSAMPGIVGFKK